MRHAVFGRRLSRDTNARKALLLNLTNSMLVGGSVTTTLAKAKFARPYVEKVVTDAKKNKLSKKRFLSSRLTHDAFVRLIQEIGPGFASRNGGYTRIINLNKRLGDAAPMARLEFVEWPLVKKSASTSEDKNQSKKLMAKAKVQKPVTQKSQKKIKKTQRRK